MLQCVLEIGEGARPRSVVSGHPSLGDGVDRHGVEKVELVAARRLVRGDADINPQFALTLRLLAEAAAIWPTIGGPRHIDGSVHPPASGRALSLGISTISEA